MERRNPYLLLGIPFGASRDEVSKAYTRKVTASKAAGGTPQADLAWALLQIEKGPQPPEAGLAPYRVPADPQWSYVDGPGVFAPPPETPSATDTAVQAAHQALQLSAAHEYLNWLLVQRSHQVGPPDP